MRLRDQKGVALAFTLFLLIFLLGFTIIFTMRTINEAKLVRIEKNRVTAFYVSEGGAQSGLEGLDTLINNYLQNTITSTNPSTILSAASSYVTSGDGLSLLINYVKTAGGAPVLTLNGSQAEYSFSSSLGSGSYQYQIVMTEKSDPILVNVDTWDFPYNYQVLSTGTVSSMNKNVLLNGDFTVRVQRDNFAKYALFTNDQTMPNGTSVWFTDKTNFEGPLHTNGRYNFYGNPGGVFDGSVAEHEQLARFYNNGSPVLLDADLNGVRDVPTFNAGFTRGADIITLSSTSDEQDMADQAAGGQVFATDGIYVPNNGTALTGGVYVRGSSSVSLSVNGSNQQVYTLSQGGTTKIITVDRVNATTSVETVGGSTQNFAGVPDGVDGVGTVLYVSGSISSLGGSVQSSTQMTIASSSNLTISNNLTYTDYTAGSGTPGTAGYVAPSAVGTNNLLGLVSWNGDVKIGTSAPDNVNVHATILARNGVFTVDNYNDNGAGPRGTATLLGGVITDNYGAFGTFNGATGQQLSGYGRNFVYDQRMQSGSAPPYFPSLNTFIAFTNDITDKVIWQEG